MQLVLIVWIRTRDSWVPGIFLRNEHAMQRVLSVFSAAVTRPARQSSGDDVHLQVFHRPMRVLATAKRHKGKHSPNARLRDHVK